MPTAQELYDLADRIDPNKLWAAPLMIRNLNQQEQDQLDGGVNLRRYASLLGSKNWTVVTPGGGTSFVATTLDRATEMAARHAKLYIAKPPGVSELMQLVEQVSHCAMNYAQNQNDDHANRRLTDAHKLLRTALEQQAIKMASLTEELTAAQDEINCTESVMEAFSCEFTEEAFNQGFDCLGDFARALWEAHKKSKV